MEGKQIIAVTNRNLCTRPFLQVMEELAQKELKTIVLRRRICQKKNMKNWRAGAWKSAKKQEQI